MRARLVVIGLVLIAFAQFGAWFLDNYNRVSRDIYIGYRGEARYNEFLAAQRFTEALGLEADSQADLSPGDWMPPLDDTVVLADRHRTLSDDDIDLLLLWVGAGGHLVAAPLASDEETDNRLFDELGVQVSDATGRALATAESLNDGCIAPCAVAPDSESAGPATVQSSAPDNPAPQRQRFTVAVKGKAVRINRSQPRLHFEGFEVLDAGGDALGDFYLHLAYGQGHITLLADTLFSINSATLSSRCSPWFSCKVLSGVVSSQVR